MSLSTDFLVEILSFNKAKNLFRLKFVNSTFSVIQRFFKEKLGVKICQINLRKDFYIIWFHNRCFEYGKLPALGLKREWPKNLHFSYFIASFESDYKTNQTGEKWIQNALEFLKYIKFVWFHNHLGICWNSLMFKTEDFNYILKELCSDVTGSYLGPNGYLSEDYLVEISMTDYNNILNMDNEILMEFLHKGIKDDFFSYKLRTLIIYVFQVNTQQLINLAPFNTLCKQLEKSFPDEKNKIKYIFQFGNFTDVVALHYPSPHSCDIRQLVCKATSEHSLFICRRERLDFVAPSVQPMIFPFSFKTSY